MTDQPAPTIRDVIAKAIGAVGFARNGTAICAALGIDPATPAANLVALQPGQAVIEWRNPRPGENYYAVSPELSRPAAVIIRHAAGEPA